MRKWRKRIVSVILILAVFVTMLPVVAKTDVSYAAEEPEKVVRGVVDAIEQLPQWGNADYRTLERGTAERPFVILEIVPYEEMAEFGYQISGCEPVAIEQMYGRGEMGKIASLLDAEVSMHTAYFFPDEPEGKTENYDEGLLNQIDWMDVTVDGYYEVVEEGTGNFIAEVITVTESEGGTEEPTEEPDTGNASEGTGTPGATAGTGAANAGAGTPGATADTGAASAGTGTPGATADTGTASAGTGTPGTATGTDAGNAGTGTPGATADTGTASAGTGTPGTAAGTDAAGADAQAAGTQDAGNAGTDAQAAEPQGASGMSGTATDTTNVDNRAQDAGTAEQTGTGTTADMDVANAGADAGIAAQDAGAGTPGTTADTGAASAGTDAPGTAANTNTTNVDIAAQAAATDMPTEPQETVTEATEEPVEPAETVQISFIPQEGGNLIWHTVNDFEKDDYEGIAFDGDPTQSIANIGDRFYTKRESAGDHRTIMCTYNYWTYKHNEHFLTQTLGLDEEAAASYSVVIKTITPEELNRGIEEGKDWIAYADLINLSPKSHDTALLETWQKYNRLGHESSLTDLNGIENGFTAENDISWEAALEIYNRVTAETDYAAIIVDDGVYNAVSGYEKSSGAVSIDVPDWNMQSSGITYQAEGYSNNVYKLAVMLFSMKPELFHALYLDGDDPVIKDGKNTRLTGEAAEYWNFYTFLPVPPEMDREPGFQPYVYWTSSEAWDNYRITAVPTDGAYKNWTSDHVFSYIGGNDILRGAYVTNILSNTDQFPEFKQYLEENGIADATPAKAVAFILGIGTAEKTPLSGTLHILDIEPSVDLAISSEDHYSYETKWQLQESYIRMLLPSFTGEIEITHQTTAEFNGKTEDLNSTYDMIFLGLDYSAYNTRTMSLQLNSGSWVSGDFPDWNDNSMDGLIYFHMGDALESAEIWTDGGSRNRSVKFLWDAGTGTNVDSTEMRFPGNDISSLKCEELAEFARAGYPIVAGRHLYDLEKSMVDETSNIYQFVQRYREAGGDPAGGETWNKGVYSISETAAITAALGDLKEVVTFTALPTLYNGETQGTIIADPNYLPVDSGRSYLEFHFHVEEAGYSYNVYVDSDRDGKFEDEEIIRMSTANVGDNSFVYRLPTSLVGLLQWKIEVFQTDTPEARYVETGCSAARNISSVKKTVKVLQIMPKDGWYDGCLNLETSELFRKYYKDLADFDISIKTITWGTFTDYFRNSDFHYDMSKEIGAEYNNPVNEDKIRSDADLGSYNMIIVGFGDVYGAQDLSDTKAVEYLQYYIAQGKSVLFTHDVTSMYNMQIGEVFGTTANAMLRDEMGMNRYKAVSSRLSSGMRDSLMAYQNLPENDHYDTIDSLAKHGFTYYAMKRLGWGSNVNYNYKMPYRYMVTGPDNKAVCGLSDFTRRTGINNNNDITTRVSKLNEGQITVYPYKIDDSFTIAETHAQWYQLNMEDPEVTVWYCLDNDDRYHGWDGTDNNGAGTALTYGVSPNDAANNYYIYSKGNVFYSGVGHSTVNGDMEAKLFINTMIAAYQASYEAPEIEITNKDAVMSSTRNYTMEVMREFDNGVTPQAGEADAGTNVQIEEVFTDSDTVKITFTPVDFNPVQTSLDGCIYRLDEDGNVDGYIDEIYRVSDDSVIRADENHRFAGLVNGTEYYIYYKKVWLDTWSRLGFGLKNNRVTQENTTTLTLSAQPLFELD